MMDNNSRTFMSINILKIAYSVTALLAGLIIAIINSNILCVFAVSLTIPILALGIIGMAKKTTVSDTATLVLLILTLIINLILSILVSVIPTSNYVEFYYYQYLSYIGFITCILSIAFGIPLAIKCRREKKGAEPTD